MKGPRQSPPIVRSTRRGNRETNAGISSCSGEGMVKRKADQLLAVVLGVQEISSTVEATLNEPIKADTVKA